MGNKDTTDNWKNIRQKWQKLLGIIEEKFCHWYYKNQTAYSVRILYAWRYQPKPQDDTKKKKDKKQEPRYSKTGVPSTQYYGQPMDFSTDWNLGRRLISHRPRIFQIARFGRCPICKNRTITLQKKKNPQNLKTGYKDASRNSLQSALKINLQT